MAVPEGWTDALQTTQRSPSDKCVLDFTVMDFSKYLLCSGTVAGGLMGTIPQAFRLARPAATGSQGSQKEPSVPARGRKARAAAGDLAGGAHRVGCGL